MKAGWRTATIGELCNLFTGGTPSRTRPEYFEGGDIRWLVSGDIHRGVIDNCEGRITQAGMENSSAKFLPLNSVLIALNGQGKTRGTVALLRAKATCNQSLVAISPRNPHELMPEFLYANLGGRYEELRRITGDDDKDRRGLNMPLIRAIRVPVPPLAEQERIVRILDEALDGIAAARANTEANLANGSALFDAALAQTFAAPGPAWAPRTLSSVSSDFGRGKSRHRPRNDPSLYGGAYPFVQTGDVRNADHVLTSYAVTYNEVGLRQSKLWPAGTLCITIAANIAESAVLGFDSCFPDSVVGLVPDPHAADSEFLEYLISHHRQVLKSKGKGSAQDNINLATFEDSAFPMPPVDEQARIAAELNKIRDLSSVLRVRRGRQERNLEDLRSSVLSAAFAGEL